MLQGKRDGGEPMRVIGQQMQPTAVHKEANWTDSNVTQHATVTGHDSAAKRRFGKWASTDDQPCIDDLQKHRSGMLPAAAKEAGR